MLIGVISDTHGLLRPEVFTAFEGVDRILHAGDVGDDEALLTELGAIAPVDAVYGNTDRFPLVTRLREWRLLHFEEAVLLLTHIVDRAEQLRSRRAEAAEARVIVYGHTHKPQIRRDREVLYFNPGAAGPRRFSLRPSVGILQIEGDSVQPRILELG